VAEAECGGGGRRVLALDERVRDDAHEKLKCKVAHRWKTPTSPSEARNTKQRHVWPITVQPGVRVFNTAWDREENRQAFWAFLAFSFLRFSHSEASPNQVIYKSYSVIKFNAYIYAYIVNA
jgi:hypothetical protein